MPVGGPGRVEWSLRALALLLAGALLAGIGLVVWQIYPVFWSAGHPSYAEEYPQRISYGFTGSKLPDRPGPLALTFYDNDFGGGYEVGVTPGGRGYRLGSGGAVLSPSGRYLLTSQPDRGEDAGELVQVHDLVTGRQRTFEDITTGRGSGGIRYRAELGDGDTVFWAPDDSSVLLLLDDRQRRSRGSLGVLDPVSGDVEPLGHGALAGYASAHEAVTVAKTGGDEPVRITATTTDLRDGATRTLPLRLADPWRGPSPLGLDASVSPDGRTLLLAEQVRVESPRTRLRRFSLADGHELAARTITHQDRFGRITWLGQDPVVPTKVLGHPAGSMVVTASGPRPLVALHPRLQSFTVQWASRALAGGHRWSPFATRTAAWTWYWWLALPVLIVLLLLDLRALRTHRRRTRATAQ